MFGVPEMAPNYVTEAPQNTPVSQTWATCHWPSQMSRKWKPSQLRSSQTAVWRNHSLSECSCSTVDQINHQLTASRKRSRHLWWPFYFVCLQLLLLWSFCASCIEVTDTEWTGGHTLQRGAFLISVQQDMNVCAVCERFSSPQLTLLLNHHSVFLFYLHFHFKSFLEFLDVFTCDDLMWITLHVTLSLLTIRERLSGNWGMGISSLTIKDYEAASALKPQICAAVLISGWFIFHRCSNHDEEITKQSYLVNPLRFLHPDFFAELSNHSSHKKKHKSLQVYNLWLTSGCHMMPPSLVSVWFQNTSMTTSTRDQPSKHSEFRTSHIKRVVVVDPSILSIQSILINIIYIK